MKIIYTLLALWNAVNFGTLFYFAYRYIWFGVETIPEERELAITGIAFVIAMLTGIVFGMHQESKSNH